MKRESVPMLILLLLLFQAFAPLAPLTSAGEARDGDPDFDVTEFTISAGGSVESSTGITVAPNSHTLRILVKNLGTAEGGFAVQVHHWTTWPAGAGDTPTLVGTLAISALAAGATSNPLSVSWTATIGANQRLTATVLSVDDVNSNNDAEQLLFDVAMLEEGEVLDDDLPVAGAGQPTARLLRSITDIDITVRNSGVMPVNAEAELRFTPTSGGAPVSFFSSDDNLQPGTLWQTAQGHILTVSVDGTTMSGTYTLESFVVFTDSTGSTPVAIQPSYTVVFSNFAAELVAPTDLAIEPGTSTQLTFLIRNTGTEADAFDITISDTEGWADLSLDGTSTANIPSGAIHHIAISVSIPISTARGTTTTVTLSLLSQSADAYTLTANTAVMSGDLYQGTLALVTTAPVNMQPGTEVDIEFTLTNTGNVPSAYSLTAGLSTPAVGWDIRLGAATSDIVLVAGVADVHVYVTPPELTLPLDPALKLRAGDTITMWVQAIPTLGGMPTSSSAAMLMDPVISVSPVLSTNEIFLTEQEVLEGLGAGGVEKFVDFQIEVRHNLILPDSAETVDVSLAVNALQFTPASIGGTSETTRWSADSSIDDVTLAMGVSQSASLGFLGPNSPLPLAGELVIPLQATPTLGAAHIGSGVVADNVISELTVHIPSISAAQISESGPLDVGSGLNTTLTIPFNNSGNDVSSYIVSISEDVPEGWGAYIDTGSTTNVIDNLSAQMEAWPLDDGRHSTTFDLIVNASNETLADTVETLTIMVHDQTTGELILTHQIDVRVEERIDLTIAPEEQLVNMTVFEQPFTRVFIYNTGNAVTTYSIWMDTSESGEVDFEIESGYELVIPPGFNDSVKVRLTPNVEASADIIYRATIWVSTDTGLNLSSVINVSIIPTHDLVVTVPSGTNVIPGTTATIEVTLTNNGNLIEYLTPVVSIDGNWSSSITPDTVTIGMNESVTLSIDVSVPSLGGEAELSNGDLHVLSIDFIDALDTNITRASGSGSLLIAALFDLNTEDWDSEALFFRYGTWDYNPVLINTGNADIEVMLEYSILRPGTSIPSTDWQLDAGATMVLTLQRGVPINLPFSVSATQSEPAHTLSATLNIDISPTDENVTGTASMTSNLRMERMFQTTPAQIDATDASAAVQQTVHWSHIPLTATSSATYELEFCGAQRLLELSGEEYDWEFSVVTPIGNQLLNFSDSCTPGIPSSGLKMELPNADPWVINDLQFLVTTPEWPNIYANDGWDLTFRLYHPDEHSGYSNYVESTISFVLNNSADPTLRNIRFYHDDYMVEGEVDTVFVTLRNEGTAITIGVTVTLDCGPDVQVTPRQQYPIPILFPTDEWGELSWFVTPNLLDWWDDSEPLSCTATLTAASAPGDEMVNNAMTHTGEIRSSGPDTVYAVLGFALMLLATMVCLRLGIRSEKFRLASAYTGVLALGLAFHLSMWGWFGPLTVALAVLWLFLSTWRSGEEFQLIHEDYQRARKGMSTMYREHQVELNSLRKQLSFILAMPILGYIAIVLAFPPQMNPDLINIVTLLAVMLGTVMGISRLLRWIDFTYGELYGQMTDTEMAVARIDRELSDPARMMQEMAKTGFESLMPTEEPEGGETDG